MRELALIALLLVLLVVSSSAAERIFKLLDLIATKPRNALEQATIENLLTVRMGMLMEELEQLISEGKPAMLEPKPTSTIQLFRANLAQRVATAQSHAEKEQDEAFWADLDLEAPPPSGAAEGTLGAGGVGGGDRVEPVDALDWEQWGEDSLVGPGLGEGDVATAAALQGLLEELDAAELAAGRIEDERVEALESTDVSGIASGSGASGGGASAAAADGGSSG